MNNVKIITDSTCDLPHEIIEKYDICVVPLYVCFGEESFQDGIEINTASLYDEVEKRDMLPKTSAVSPAKFMEIFQSYIDQGMDIVYIGIGSTLSSTYNNAFVAASNFDDNRIFLVDSLNLSSAIGLLLLKACKFKQQGMSAAQIKEKVDVLVPKVHAQFSVAKLDFLHKGGRCSGTTKFFGTMLRVKPIIRVNNGVLNVADKAYGKFSKALDLMIQDLIDHKDILDTDCVMITHSLGDDECAYILERIPQDIKDKVELLLETHAGCVISSHCGRRTIGILYITTK